MNYNRFTLGICELFHPYIHGVNDDSDTTICEKLIVHSTFKAKKFYDFKNNLLDRRSSLKESKICNCIIF